MRSGNGSVQWVSYSGSRKMKKLFTHSIIGNISKSKGYPKMISTTKHKNENDSRLPYTLSMTKLEEEGKGSWESQRELGMDFKRDDGGVL